MSVLKPLEYYINKTMVDYPSYNNDIIKKQYEYISEHNFTFDDNLNVNCKNMNEKCYCCRDCDNCFDCIDCIKCNNCKNCRAMSNCNDCIDCIDCESCDRCNNCMECQFSDDCNKCSSMIGSENCINCSDCRQCKYCESCNKCCSTVDYPQDNEYSRNLKYCENCTDCHDCTECSNCLDCYNMEKCYDCKVSNNCKNCHDIDYDNDLESTNSIRMELSPDESRYKVIKDLKLIIRYDYNSYYPKNVSEFISTLSNLYKRTFKDKKYGTIVNDSRLAMKLHYPEIFWEINDFEDLDKLLTMIEQEYKFFGAGKFVINIIDDFKYLEIEPALKQLKESCPKYFKDNSINEIPKPVISFKTLNNSIPTIQPQLNN